MIMQVEPAYEDSLPFPPSPLPIVDTSSTQQLQAIRAREDEEEEDLEDAQQVLLPRAYQDEVYKLAKERNTIVRLDTVSRVESSRVEFRSWVMLDTDLIRTPSSMMTGSWEDLHFHHVDKVHHVDASTCFRTSQGEMILYGIPKVQDLPKLIQPTTPPSRPPQIVVFLCPSVPLVHQQARTISCQTDLNVKSFTGGVTKTKGMAWNKELWEQELDSSDIVVMTPMVRPFSDFLVFAFGPWCAERGSGPVGV
jgi:hypothetical protein